MVCRRADRDDVTPFGHPSHVIDSDPVSIISDALGTLRSVYSSKSVCRGCLFADPTRRPETGTHVELGPAKAYRGADRFVCGPLADRSNDPVGRVAAEIDAPRDSVKWYLKLDAKEREHQSRNRRNREIVRLAREGMSNKDLSSRFGLHRNTVQRIVAGGFRSRITRLPRS